MIRDYRDTFFQCCIGQVFGTSSNGLYREENCFALVKVLFRGFDVGARGVVWFGLVWSKFFLEVLM